MRPDHGKKQVGGGAIGDRIRVEPHEKETAHIDGHVLSAGNLTRSPSRVADGAAQGKAELSYCRSNRRALTEARREENASGRMRVAPGVVDKLGSDRVAG